ncbi:MAG TPA: BON domain-containing protein [Vicinamibacterales bacterium]|jgi:hyperosmotically inducible protein
MFRALFKLVLLVVILVAVGGFFLGWWSARPTLPEGGAVATAGRAGAERAREVGAKIGEKTAVAAQQAKEALGDGAITAKIKAKMALDDHVKALDLNVDTVNGDVTVSGKVRSNAERDRAIALARETEGVRRVVDKITVARAR